VGKDPISGAMIPGSSGLPVGYPPPEGGGQPLYHRNGSGPEGSIPKVDGQRCWEAGASTPEMRVTPQTLHPPRGSPPPFLKKKRFSLD